MNPEKLTRIKLFSNCSLIDSYEMNDTVLLHNGHTFYMSSIKTGIHSVVGTKLNERVLAHWNGFKANQSK
jgi:hypothetical protein